MAKIKKLNKTFKINPLYESDGYKIGHKEMLAPNTNFLYGTLIPRNLKYLKNINKVMSAGHQLSWRYIHSVFQENFFNVPKEQAIKFIDDIWKYLGFEFNGTHFEELYDLGYLPLKVKALPEGIFTDANIVHQTFINTVKGYAWFTLFMETLISKVSWQTPLASTLGFEFRKNAMVWANKTDKNNLVFTKFACHDFHSRGGNPFSSIALGLGHAFSNLGSDTLNVIPASRYYYDFDENEVPIFSVNASEHSVTTTGIFYYEKLLKEYKLNNEIKYYYSFDLPCDGSIDNPDYLAIAEFLNLRDWLVKFPEGILSVVSDTFDLWKLITFILPRLKNEILARNGKLVIRPDSGDPVDIICGTIKNNTYFDEIGEYSTKENYYKRVKGTLEYNTSKGVIELLWDVFGGTINEQGYKVLDSHIGAIYGDSINLERQVQIYERLANKSFASTNIVLGVGSYTYVYQTRDTIGMAVKGAWFESNGISFNIYKDPITDDGTKKSLKGLQAVLKDDNDNYYMKSECTKEEEETGCLQLIYENGEFYNQTTLIEIREKIENELKLKI